MNILWIEDFGGLLEPNTATLSSMFKELINFEDWDEDELSLINASDDSRPTDLEEYCKRNSLDYCVYLCRHYFDYVEFKSNHDFLKKIDTVIIDIRLDKDVDLSKPIPPGYQDANKFHTHAGFYIYNDLVHLGFPFEKMCFMTGEKNSLTGFQKNCRDLYIPNVSGFEKNDAEYKKLRQWIKKRETDYLILRRGVIEGCQFVKDLSEDKFYYNEFSTKKEPLDPEDIRNYLEIIENFFPLREPKNKKDVYKLFVRTLSHEWESADTIRRNKDKKDAVLAWVMRNTRHWITHNSGLFGDLDEKMVAYLFIVNLRVMFNSGDDTLQSYEQLLLNLFREEALSEADFKIKSKNRLFPVSKAYLDLKNLVLDEKNERININDAFYFNELANNIQMSDSTLRSDVQLFNKLLYQMFWLVTSNPFISTGNKRNLLEIKFRAFNYLEKPYITELARHIYHSSFPDV